MQVLRKRSRRDARPSRSSRGCWPHGCGDEGCVPAPAPATTTVAPLSAPPPRRQSTDPNLLIGVAGFARGWRSARSFRSAAWRSRSPKTGAGVDAERGTSRPRRSTRRSGQLEALRAQLHAKADPAKAAIFAAHEELTR